MVVGRIYLSADCADGPLHLVPLVVEVCLEDVDTVITRIQLLNKQCIVWKPWENIKNYINPKPMLIPHLYISIIVNDFTPFSSEYIQMIQRYAGVLIYDNK